MTIKMNEVKELSRKEAEAKIAELEKAILESRGEGKADAVKSLRKGIARLRTYLSSPASQEKASDKAKAPDKK